MVPSGQKHPSRQLNESFSMAEPHDGSFNGPHDLYTRPLVQFKAESGRAMRERNWLNATCCNTREKLTTNLPISPSIIQLNATKATVLGERRDAIANALGALVAVLAVAVVRDAIFHQDVLVKHLKAIFHFGILEEVRADEIRLLLDGRLAAKRRDWLRARNALRFVLVHVGRSPGVDKRRCHLEDRNLISKRKHFQ
jgi:hypothetical protein